MQIDPASTLGATIRGLNPRTLGRFSVLIRRSFVEPDLWCAAGVALLWPFLRPNVHHRRRAGLHAHADSKRREQTRQVHQRTIIVCERSQHVFARRNVFESEGTARAAARHPNVSYFALIPPD